MGAVDRLLFVVLLSDNGRWLILGGIVSCIACSMTILWYERIHTPIDRYLRWDVKSESVLHHWRIHVRLNQADICVALESACLQGAVIELICGRVLLKRHSIETIILWLTIHDGHYLFQHLLILGVDFPDFIVSLIHTACAQVLVLNRLWISLVNPLLHFHELIQQVLSLLGLHKHGGRVAWQLRIHFFFETLFYSNCYFLVF